MIHLSHCIILLFHLSIRYSRCQVRQMNGDSRTAPGQAANIQKSLTDVSMERETAALIWLIVWVSEVALIHNLLPKHA